MEGYGTPDGVGVRGVTAERDIARRMNVNVSAAKGYEKAYRGKRSPLDFCSSSLPPLPIVGIDKNLADRARKYAA